MEQESRGICFVNKKFMDAFLSSGHHARGKYFHIYVMPEGGEPSHYGHAPDGSVEVYGILGGQPGWTEYYGWLHAGPAKRLCGDCRKTARRN